LKFLEEYAKKASSRREVMAKEALTKGGKRKKLSKKATREVCSLPFYNKVKYILVEQCEFGRTKAT
jgi:hypothetical protein